MVVTLIGYRGSGKTSVARLLATVIDCEEIDADDEVERRAGRTIAEIFAEHGEAEFRRLEKEVLHDLLGRSPLVLAAGGGAVLDPDNRAAMRDAGAVVWLRAPASFLAERVAGDRTTADRRPSLSGGDVIDEIAPILAEREPLYAAAATCEVQTDGRDLNEVVAEIIRLLGIAPGEGSLL